LACCGFFPKTEKNNEVMFRIYQPKFNDTKNFHIQNEMKNQQNKKNKK